jgi:uncharacterized protein (DUF433 family)
MGAATRGVQVVDGVAVVAGRSVLTADIREAFMEGESPDTIARRLHLSPEDVESAIRFECCKTCPCDTCAWARVRAEMETP